MKTKHGLPLFIFAILLTSCCKDPIGSTDGTFKDSRDNHLYKYVKIGTQTWMAENLAYLPAVNPSEDGSYNEPYYYVYDFQGNDVAKAKEALNFQTYGCLYNWVAAVNACPQGWHLPTDKEWMILEIYLGMSGYSGDVDPLVRSYCPPSGMMVQRTQMTDNFTDFFLNSLHAILFCMQYVF